MNNEIKVTQLPSANTITQNDLLMVVQNNENKKATSSQFLDMLEDDLENYYTKTETDALLDDKADTSEIPSNDNLVNVGSSVDTDYKVNVITTKNLFDKDTMVYGEIYYLPADTTNTQLRQMAGGGGVLITKLQEGATYTISKRAGARFRAGFTTTPTPVANTNNVITSRTPNNDNGTSITFVVPNGSPYFVCNFFSIDQTTDANIGYENMLNTIQIEKNNQATTYEAFIPNTINVNNEKYTDTINVGTTINDKNRVNVLYSHNLFDKNNINVLNAYIGTANGTIASLNNGRTIWIPIKANTTYTISKLKSARFVIATYTTQPAINVSGTNVVYNNDATSLTITSGANDKYLAVWLFNGDVDTLTYQQIIDSLMINEGSEALPYEPYLTPSINVDGDEIYNANVMNYSTSEQICGTWLGKTLYKISGEKSVSGDPQTTQQQVDLISNIPSTWVLVKTEGSITFYGSTNNRIQSLNINLNYNGTNDGGFCSLYIAGNNSLRTRYKADVPNVTTSLIRFTMYYTKD